MYEICFPTKNLGPIGSAVFTFIGYKQTNRHPDKPNLYIDEQKNGFWSVFPYIFPEGKTVPYFDKTKTKFWI